ncbi:uncharacterized protein LOC113531950 isoform X2 [Pangasianodon hypophthalmus]|uniref:uncharacterized protein LOC113531950 isoform X2 n=1 Tax=Pangasianodon hypophthalmus TaxID=310915 RepID=UPI0023070798|nr:uncharacterized protein LOC113531950 isoform X2 [Pangasianodon hypophthalmus]
MLVNAAAVSHMEMPVFPIIYNFLECLTDQSHSELSKVEDLEIDSEPLDHISILIRDDERGCQSASGLHGGRSSNSSSELNTAIVKEEFQQIISAMSNKALSSDSGSPSPPIHILPDTKSTNLATKAVMNAIVSTMNDCLDVMEDSLVLQLFTSVAQKLEILASTSSSEMLFKSKCENDSFDLHSKASGDDLSAASNSVVKTLVSRSYVSLDDDSVVDDSSFGQVPFKWPDVSLGCGSDANDDDFSYSENFSMSSMKENIVCEFRTEASCLVSEVLSQSVKIINADADIPEAVKGLISQSDASYSEPPDPDIAASKIVEKFVVHICDLLDFEQFPQLAADNLWKLANDLYYSVMCQVNEFLLSHQQRLAEIREVIGVNEQLQSSEDAEHAHNVTGSKQKNVEVDKPSSAHVVSVNPLVDTLMASLDLDHAGHFETLSIQCVDEVFSIYSVELYSIEDQESQQTDTAGSGSESRPALQWTLETISEAEEALDVTSYNFEQTVSSFEQTVCMGSRSELFEVLKSQNTQLTGSLAFSIVRTLQNTNPDDIYVTSPMLHQPYSSSSQESQKIRKKHLQLKMQKLKNPFKKLRKGQKGSFASLDQKQHGSTDADMSTFTIVQKAWIRKRRS